jgi:hypothetical protein
VFDDYGKTSASEWPLGVLIAWGLHALQAVFGPLTDWYSLVYIGAFQLLYLLPAIAWFRHEKRNEVIIGLIIGGSITLLLNASCFALFWNLH